MILMIAKSIEGIMYYVNPVNRDFFAMPNGATAIGRSDELHDQREDSIFI
jgi:hypothetical protein